MHSILSEEIQIILEKETGPMGNFILKKQCGLLDIPPENIGEEHLPKLALKLSEALLVFGKEKANRVYMDIKKLSSKDGSSRGTGLEQELDLAQAAGNVGNLSEEKEHLSRAEEMGAAEHPIMAGRFHCLKGALLLREGELERARNEYETALDLYRSKKDKSGEIDAIFGLGNVLWREGKYSEAKDALVRCAKMSKNENDANKEGRCYMSLGNIHEEWGKFEDALSYSNMSKDVFEKSGNERALATLHNNMGVAYARRGLFRESLVEYKICISLANSTGYKMMEGWALFNAAEDNARLGHYKEALDMCKRSEGIFEELGDKLGISGVHMSYAVAYWLQGDAANAEKHFSKTLEIRRLLGMPYRLADALYEHGRFLADVDRIEEAKKEFDESLNIFKSLNNEDRVEQLKKAIAGIKH